MTISKDEIETILFLFGLMTIVIYYYIAKNS